MPEMPTCLTTAQKKVAVDFCVQSKSPGQAAVAAYGFLGAVDPMTRRMAERPCDWAKLPLCPTVAFPGTAAPRALSPEVLALRPPPTPTPKSSSGISPMMLGGAIAGVVLVAGVVYFATRKAS